MDRKKTSSETPVKILRLYFLDSDLFQKEGEKNSILKDEGIQFETSEDLAAFVMEKRNTVGLWKNEKEKMELGIQVHLYPLESFPEVKMK